MGIHELIPFLKKHSPECFVRIQAKYISRKRIAIDGHSWLFTNLGICVKKEIELKKYDHIIEPEKVFINILKMFIRFNIKLLNHKITPVWIWDGTSLPAKLDTKEKRKEDRKKRENKKNDLREKLDNLSVLERSSELIEDYKKLVVQSFYFPSKNIDELKEVSKLIGLPTITARSEGERLASALAVKRLVACVWSGDTDTYVLGAPFVTKRIEYQGRELYIEGVFTLEILRQLKLSHQEFRDFCILCGCDFGKRMYGVGPKKSKDLIQKYRTIENIEDNEKFDTSCLNYNICRELLTPTMDEVTEVIDKLNIIPREYDEVELDKYNIREDFDIFFSRTRKFPIVESVHK